MPAPRRSSFPLASETDHVGVATVERTLRGAAADISCYFFGALPGVQAALMVQENLRWCEQHMEGSCPFVGAHRHLYSKGSLSPQEHMGKKGFKSGHDDNNGPACLTFWQNLELPLSGARPQLVIVVHGHDVVVEAAVGHVALFQAWLPHLSRAARDGPSSMSGDSRIHHTAYIRRDTEHFAWVARAHREAGLALQSVALGGGEEESHGGGEESEESEEE